MQPIVSFDRVSLNYGSFKALKEVSFELFEGSSVALVGNNGSGKTSIVHVLCNLLEYHGGTLTVFNKKVDRKYLSYKSKLGILLSQHYFIEQFSVTEYLKFVCRFQEVDKDEADSRVSDLVSVLAIDNPSIPIKKLSSGNKMKVSLAAALIHNPEVLVLDEPFVNLDIQMVERVKKILIEQKNKKTLFLTSHHLDLVTDICDIFLVIEKGCIVKTIRRNDFTDTDHLKDSIKKELSPEAHLDNISWLE